MMRLQCESTKIKLPNHAVKQKLLIIFGNMMQIFGSQAGMILPAPIIIFMRAGTMLPDFINSRLSYKVKCCRLNKIRG
jgi:hypothetical protein